MLKILCIVKYIYILLSLDFTFLPSSGARMTLSAILFTLLVGQGLRIVTVVSESYPKHIGADFSFGLLKLPNIIPDAASTAPPLFLRPQTIAQPQIYQTLELRLLKTEN